MQSTIKSLLLILSLSYLISCQSGADAPSGPEGEGLPQREVETAIVHPVDFSETVFATGRLSSKEEIKLSFKTGGIIRQIHVREGQSVRKGQLLAELDLDEIRAQTEQARLGRDQAEISIENAKLAVQLAERDFQNVKGLYEDSVATLVQLENAEIALDNARNQLEAAQTGLSVTDQQVTVAQFNLKHSRITAPSDGVILKKLAEPSELVGAGTPVFFFGSRDKAMVIKVHVPDKDIIYIQLEDEAEVAFDAYPNETFRGIVREVASTADPYTGTYEVEVEVLPEGKRLISGFIGTVHIHTREKSKLMELPIDALSTADEQRGVVFLLEEGRARRTEVTISRIRGDRLLVLTGVKAGDTVITSGVGYLEDAQPVRPMTEEQRSASAK